MLILEWSNNGLCAETLYSYKNITTNILVSKVEWRYSTVYDAKTAVWCSDSWMML